MALQSPEFRPFPDVQLSKKEQITARGGEDLILAAYLSGPQAKYPDHRFVDHPDADGEPHTFGTNFVRRPIDKFTFLDALEEALGTTGYQELAAQANLSRRGPLDLYGNLHSNAQHVVKVLLGRDPLTGKDYPRNSPPPHVVLEGKVRELAEVGNSAMALAVDKR